MKRTRLLFLLCIALPTLSFAELKDENLLQSIPQGYKIDYQTQQGNVLLTEMVPKAETVNNWTEMVTTHVYLGAKNLSHESFQAEMEKSWLAACKGGEIAPIKKGNENGYAFSMWVQTCPNYPATGKPEDTLLKAIKGNDSYYVVQKAFRFEPTDEQISRWVLYLRTVGVCDTRLADRPCPKPLTGAETPITVPAP
jgi:hypothetical protein